MNGVEKATRAFSDIVAVPTGALILVAAIKLPEALAWLAFAAAILAAIRGFMRVGRNYPRFEMLHGLVSGNRLIDLVFDCVIATFGAYAVFSILAVRSIEVAPFY